MEKSKFQMLGSPRIIESKFKLNTDFSGRGEISVDIDNKVEVLKLENEDNIALVRLEIGIFNESLIETAPFQIFVIIEGAFTWSEELEEDKDLLESLLNENAPAVLYGYVRQEIRMMTINAGVPILDIPLMDFTK